MPEKLRPEPLVGAIAALASRQADEDTDEWATWW
jgi:hypothetical protein